MEQYSVTGMSCAACSTHVEKAVRKVEGVESVAVSLLTNSMAVEGSARSVDIIKAVENAGYGADVKTSSSNVGSGSAEYMGDMQRSSVSAMEDSLKDRETPHLKKRFIASLIFMIPLMYISMGHMMWGWPVPQVLDGNHMAIGLIQLLFTAIIIVINQKFFISGFVSTIHRAPNMDTLVALGAGASFVYSVYALFAMTDAITHGNHDSMMSYMHEFYFESAAMILTLITLGKLLEAHSKGRTTDALKGLVKLAPKLATVVRDGAEVQVSVETVKKGDIFVVRPGESIPVDGVVIEGNSAIDESALTGESIPVDKNEGDMISAATINQSGFIRCEATRVGEDTTLSKIIQMVSDAAATKAPIAKVADKVSGIFVPVVILIAIVTIFAWLLAGQTIGFALARGISVLVISCPCALGLATPVAIMVGNGIGAKHGILFKTAVSLEETGRVDVIALDKTGTITLGKPEVTDIIPGKNVTADELITLAYTLEEKSEHPLARAIVEYAQNKDNGNSNIIRDAKGFQAVDFKAVPGNGLIATVSDFRLIGGNLKYIEEFTQVDESTQNTAIRLSEEGKTPLFFCRQSLNNEINKHEKAGELIGIIAVADVIKPDSAEAIKQLRSMGIRVVMLTGDNERTANAVGAQVGVDDVIAGVLPDGKEDIIRKLKSDGSRVAMVGDGINDAPALTRADIGIAIGAGTDIAIDAADVVLMKSGLVDVPAAIRLSRAVLKNIHQNLFWAFIYNVIGIPLAAGIWYPLLGWKLNPMYGAAAMSLSSFCVVTNSLRLNLANVYSVKKDKNIRSSRKTNRNVNEDNIKGKEVNNMERIMKIEGMMCGHCEASVKKALEALAEIDEAVVSHEMGNAVVKLNAEISNGELKKTVEDLDYKVLEIK